MQKEKEAKRNVLVERLRDAVKGKTAAGAQAAEGPPSRWLSLIRKEQLDREMATDEKERRQRQRYLEFEDTDSDDEKTGDMRGQDLLKFLDNIDRHLAVE